MWHLTAGRLIWVMLAAVPRASNPADSAGPSHQRQAAATPAETAGTASTRKPRPRAVVRRSLVTQHAAVGRKLAELTELIDQLGRQTAGQQADGLVKKHRETLESLTKQWAELLPSGDQLDGLLNGKALDEPLEEIAASFAELRATARKLAPINAKLMIRAQSAASDLARQLEQFDELVDDWDGVVGNQHHVFLPKRANKPAQTPDRDATSAQKTTGKASEPAAAKAANAAQHDDELPRSAGATAETRAAMRLQAGDVPDDEAVDLEEADRMEEHVESDGPATEDGAPGSTGQAE